jgi:hypothetical protein
VAQWGGDELAILYTNIRLRHQRNQTTMGRIVPSHLAINYNGGILGDCSKLLRFRNIGVHTGEVFQRPKHSGTTRIWSMTLVITILLRLDAVRYTQSGGLRCITRIWSCCETRGWLCPFGTLHRGLRVLSVCCDDNSDDSFIHGIHKCSRLLWSCPAEQI